MITIELDYSDYRRTFISSKGKCIIIHPNIESWFQKANIPLMPWYIPTNFGGLSFIKSICFNFETKSQAALFKLRWL